MYVRVVMVIPVSSTESEHQWFFDSVTHKNNMQISDLVLLSVDLKSLQFYLDCSIP